MVNVSCDGYIWIFFVYGVVYYVLPSISYTYDELEPFVDERTMRLHHLQHHKFYVDGLNDTLSRICGSNHPQHISSILSNLSSLPVSERANVAFFGGGFENHRILWETIAPPESVTRDSNTVNHTVDDAVASNNHEHDYNKHDYVRCGDIANNVCNYILKKPSGKLDDAIDVYFGGFESFKDIFTKSAMSLQGSGWCWLVINPTYNRLEITSVFNNDTPWMFGQIPLLGLDLWEHAYYLKYQNDRLKYVNMWWYTINWQNVESRFVSNTEY